MARLVGYFARGCLAIVPVAATIYILYVLVTGLDSLLGVSVPGLGILVAVGLITAVGFLISNVIGKQIYGLFDRLMARLPLVKLLYTSIRDLVSAVVGEERKFGQPVALTLSADTETFVLGFISRESLSPLGLADHVSVYVPQAYNIGGQVLLVHRQQVRPLDVAAGELFAFVLSGGASGFSDRSGSKPG